MNHPGTQTRRSRRPAPGLLLVALAALGALALAPIASAASFRPELPALSHEGAFSTPCGVATDSHGDLYVNDAAAGTLKTHGYVYSPTGTLLTEYEVSTSGAGCYTAVDSSGDIYTSVNLGQLNKFVPSEYPPTASTTYSPDTSINQSGRIVFSSIGLNAVNGVAVDPSNQHVYVAEGAGNEVQEYQTPSESYKLKCKGVETTTLEPSSTTTDIKTALEAASPGPECKTVTVAETTNLNGITGLTRKKLTFSGTLAQTAVPAVEIVKSGGNETAAEMFRGASAPHISIYEANGTRVGGIITPPGITSPTYSGIDVYGANSDIYLADKGNTKVYVLNPTGTAIEKTITGPEGENGCKAGPFGTMEKPALAVDQSNGNVLVSDIKTNGVVDEFTSSGNCVTTIEHTPAFEESAPSDIAVDSSGASTDGNVYITSGKTGGSVFAYGSLTSAGYALKVLNGGGGQGTVTSVQSGEGGEPIDCGTHCEEEFAEGEEVELEAEDATGSEFTGWTEVNGDAGTCTGTTTPCTITMSEAKEIEATFALETFELTINESGPGSVGVECDGAACASLTAIPYGTEVTVTAEPDTPGAETTEFKDTGSAEGCEAEGSPCEFRIEEDSSVTAAFAPEEESLTVNQTGEGTVACEDEGSPVSCTGPFAYGHTITVTATPEAGGWTVGALSGEGSAEGECSFTSASGSCTFVIEEPSTVNVTFSAPGTATLAVGKSGNGEGTVTSDTGGIDCGPTCAGSFAAGETVTLAEEAQEPGSTFVAWSGNCTPISLSECEVEVKSGGSFVTATFVAVPVLTEFSGEQGPCEFGGTKIEYAGTTEYVCNGKIGEDGEPGKTIVTRSFTGSKTVGAVTCTEGGLEVEVEGEPSTLTLVCDGAKGTTGSPGSPGAKGENGAPGTQGPAGPTGLTGPQGNPGAPGTNGAKGDTGAQGPPGPQGTRGKQGPVGRVKVICKVHQNGNKSRVTCSVHQPKFAKKSKLSWRVMQGGRSRAHGRTNARGLERVLESLPPGRYVLRVDGRPTKVVIPQHRNRGGHQRGS